MPTDFPAAGAAQAPAGNVSNIQKVLLTVDEATAAGFGSRPSLYRAMRDGRLKSVKFGGRRKFRIEDLNAYANRDASDLKAA